MHIDTSPSTPVVHYGKRFGSLACLFVLAFIFSCLTVTACNAEQKLPKGFIALSEQKLNWNDAKAFCEVKKGKLPLLNNLTDSGDGLGGRPAAIDGFGKEDGAWPEGLPQGQYWSGTDEPRGNGVAWRIQYFGPPNNPKNAKNDIGAVSKGSKLRVVCVPK